VAHSGTEKSSAPGDRGHGPAGRFCEVGRILSQTMFLFVPLRENRLPWVKASPTLRRGRLTGGCENENPQKSKYLSARDSFDQWVSKTRMCAPPVGFRGGEHPVPISKHSTAFRFRRRGWCLVVFCFLYCADRPDTKRGASRG